MLRAIAPHIATDLTAPERVSIIDDEWALVRAHRHTVADYLTLAVGRATIGLHDLRPGSPTEGLGTTVELDADAPSALVIPGLRGHSSTSWVSRPRLRRPTIAKSSGPRLSKRSERQRTTRTLLQKRVAPSIERWRAGRRSNRRLPGPWSERPPRKVTRSCLTR
jgi:hypothetical protein